MNICETHRHEEIVHEGRTCPLCELIDIRDNLEAEKSDLEGTVHTLEAKVKELEREFERLDEDARKREESIGRNE